MWVFLFLWGFFLLFGFFGFFDLGFLVWFFGVGWFGFFGFLVYFFVWVLVFKSFFLFQDRVGKNTA